MEGRVFTAVATWGKQGFNTDNVAALLEKLVVYLKTAGVGLQYPDHKTVEEKAALAKQKTNRAAAIRAAKLKLRKQSSE